MKVNVKCNEFNVKNEMLAFLISLGCFLLALLQNNFSELSKILINSSHRLHSSSAEDSLFRNIRDSLNSTFNSKFDFKTFLMDRYPPIYNMYTYQSSQLHFVLFPLKCLDFYVA